jgi:hypothetical protein
VTCNLPTDQQMQRHQVLLLPLPPLLRNAVLQTLLPDGVRTVVTGGTVSMNVSTPVPSAEVYNFTSNNIVKQDTLAILQRFRGFILYPLGELCALLVANVP